MLAFSLVLLTVEHVPVLHSLCLTCFSLCYGWLSPSGVLFLLPQPIFISVVSSRHQCVASRLSDRLLPRWEFLATFSPSTWTSPTTPWWLAVFPPHLGGFFWVSNCSCFAHL